VTALIGALVDLPQHLVRILRSERQIGVDGSATWRSHATRLARSVYARQFTSFHAPPIVSESLLFAPWGILSCLQSRFAVIASCTPPVCALLFVVAADISPTRAAEHTLMPSPQTVHIGYFLAGIKPVLSIESGDIVTLESVAAIVPSVVEPG